MHWGRHSWCRDCAREATRDWGARNPELIAEQNAVRRLGERERECVDCGESFTYRHAAAVRCVGCRRLRKIEQRRTLREAAAR
jgi:hypothetical protein